MDINLPLTLLMGARGAGEGRRRQACNRGTFMTMMMTLILLVIMMVLMLMLPGAASCSALISCSFIRSLPNREPTAPPGTNRRDTLLRKSAHGRCGNPRLCIWAHAAARAFPMVAALKGGCEQ